MTDEERDLRVLLERRARALAQPMAGPSEQTIEIVTFALGGETYGVESRYVLEVSRLTQLSRLPGADPPLFGITTWRGALLNVLDLRPILGAATAETDDLCRLLVLGRDGPEFGVLVDRIYGLRSIPPSAVLNPPAGVAHRRNYVQGVTSDAVIVLAAEKLLALNN